jgi:hypothetical protein
MAETATDALRPADYLAYRDAAEAILGTESGPAALRAFGFDDVFAELPDLGPAYAFLEAQGRRGAVTPALGRVGLAADTPLPASAVLGWPLPGTTVVAVPGLPPQTPVAVDVPGTGLVVFDPAPPARRTRHPVADDYLALLEVDATGGETVVEEARMAELRPAVLARLQLGASAELLGVTDRLLRDAVAHTRSRRQFGRPLSGFQSMQHLLAWAATERHQLTCLFDIAVARSARVGTDPELARTVKAMAGRVLHAVAQAAVQATGAISFTWEYSLNQLHHRGLALDQFAGSSADLIAALGRRIRSEAAVPEFVGLGDVAVGTTR